MARKVEVVPYDPIWPALFRSEAGQLAAILGEEVAAIHHVGSTAIAGMSAKPIVDILVEVHHIAKIDGLSSEMRNLGYKPKGEFGIPGRRFFFKDRDSVRTHHVHVFQIENPEIVRHLNFRDYMMAHPEEARSYSRLKEELAKKFSDDIEGYMDGKDKFIQEIDQRARAWRHAL